MPIIAPGAVLPPMEPAFSPRGSATVDAGFRVPAPPDASGQATMGQARASLATAAASAMLALQEQTGSGSRCAPDSTDREARRHGQDLLDALAALQRALLTSAGSAQSLAHLAALAKVDLTVHDPMLARVLSSIRLRARLEILRRAARPQDAEYASAAAAMEGSVTGS